MILEKHHISWGRKMFISVIKKRGRPYKFAANNDHLTIKKENLFGTNSNAKYMNIVNIAYHSNKITSEEYEIALQIERTYHQMQTALEIKTIPKSSPSTWTTKVNSSNNSATKEKSLIEWNKIKLHIQKTEPIIANDFFNLICSHHSYHELLSLKLNSQVMAILKKGLSCLKIFY